MDIAINGRTDRATALNRIPELDALRFIAALAVVFYHLAYGSITRYGYLGVDLFFMISGYVIFWSANGRTASEFAVSRFARLYPAFWVCLAITVATGWILRDELPTMAQLMANMTMAAGYAGQEYIDGVYWTLQVELKFYALVFVLVALRQMHNAEAWLFAWLLACWIDSLFGLPSWAQSLIIAPYGPLFIAGALFLLIRTGGANRERLLGVVACLLMVVAGAQDNSAGYLFGERSQVAPVIVVALFGVMAAMAFGWLRIAPSAALTRVAAMTYPLYLLHNAIGKGIAEHAGAAAAIVVALVLAYVVSAVDAPVSRYVRRKLEAAVCRRG